MEGGLISPNPAGNSGEESKNTVEYQLPQEVLDYNPPEDAIFVTFSDGKRHRRIFAEPQEYSDEEIKTMKEFEEYWKDNGFEFPPGCTLRDAYKHVIATKTFDKAYESLQKQHEMLSSIRPVTSEGVEHFLNKGILYFCNRDKNFRPICILNLK